MAGWLVDMLIKSGWLIDRYVDKLVIVVVAMTPLLWSDYGIMKVVVEAF